ncbi:VOC family protein [Microaerobacter geothermalis]|uniref:VOC family protein n=1 Tax=Microaerobacter geothermalis TaxID=674972 RepID=UPI001F364C4A|nr:VOC family protein [Microaerobacter geothermalis]MCF6092885.1 VOC family protein [Microaerobacter geothermalis]
MIDRLIRVTILVKDQEEALRFYTEKLGFEKRADVTFGPGVRWLTVAPKGQQELEIVLQKPEPSMHGEEGAKKLSERIGQGTTWVLETNDCRKTFETLRSKGVKFLSEPKEQPWGVEALFEDLYGNIFDLLEPR